MTLNKTRTNNLLQKMFIKNCKLTCSKELKYRKFSRKRNKAKHVMKRDHSKRLTTKYIECKHKNTGTSSFQSFAYVNYIVLIHALTVEKTVTLKPSFGLSVKI